MGKRAVNKNTGPVVVAMEERQLFSIDVPGADALVPPAQPPPIEAVLDDRSHAADTTAALGDSQDGRTFEIVFVDTATPDHQSLVDGLVADPDRHIEVVYIDSDQNGLHVVSGHLASASGVDAVHLVSHGSPGEVQLGNQRLSEDLLVDNATRVAAWSSAFTETGDLLIYGCDLASTVEGEQLVDSLALLTGADVAASDDLTGNRSLGGDWDLEYQAGAIETDLVVGELARATFQGTLALTSFQEGGSGYSGTQDTFLQEDLPDDTNGSGTSVQVNLDAISGQTQALIRFDDLFGSGSGQIAPGATIYNAELTLQVLDASDVSTTVSLHRLLGAWDESASWNTMSNGVSTDDTEAKAAADSAPLPNLTGSRTIAGLADAVQAWSDGDTNYGWVILSDALGGLEFASSEHATASFRPILDVEYNEAPEITSTAETSAAEDVAYSYTVVATDVDGDGLTLTASTLPAWLSFTDHGNGTATLSGTPVQAEVGSHAVVIEVSDGNLSDTQSFNITVGDTNDAPEITSGAAVNAQENQTSVTTITSTDVDGDTVSYAISGGADQALFNLTSGGVLTFNSPPDLENPTDADTNGIYEVEVTASDGNGGSDVQLLSVTVTGVNDAPEITSTATTSATEDAPYSYTVTTSDADGDPMTLSATTLPAWLSFIDHGDGTATLSGTPGNAEVGSHAVSIEVSDGSLTDTQSFSIAVANTNDAPEITSSTAVDAAENQTDVTTVTASDDDGDSVSFSITGGADQALFSITGPGVLTFNSPPDMETPSDADTDGVYQVEVTASDGNGGTDVKTLTVTVTDVNDAPTIDSTAVTSANEDVLYSYTLTASDPDGNPITLSATTLPAWLSFTDHGDGTATLSGTPAQSDTGSHAVVIEADDGSLSDSQSFNINVGGTNDPPSITSNASVNALEHQTSVTTVTSSDVDGDTVSYTITGGPDQGWFSIDPGTGVVTFDTAPNYESPGDSDTNGVYVVEVTADDGNGGSDVQTLSVTVTDGNDPPRVTSTAATSATEDAAYSYTLSATDDNGDPLTFSATTLPGWLSLTDHGNGTATLSGTPTNDDVGANPVVVAVNDGSLSGTQSFSIAVANTNDAPIITSSSAVNAPENQTAVTTVIADDVDVGDTPTFSITGGVDAALFSITPGGVLTFVSAQDYESPGDSNTDRVYEVQVTVDDANGGTDVQDLLVTVTDANDAPVITSDGGGDTAALSAAENQTAVTTVTATDIDPADTPTFSISGGADQALFSITAGGVLTFNPAPDFEVPTDADSDGVYEVVVSASDGNGGTDAQTLSVTVTDDDDTPTDIRAVSNLSVGGLQLNDDGGNDTYLLADSGLASSLSQFTFEVLFEGSNGSTEVPFISYNTASGDIMTINTMSNNTLELDIGTGSVAFSNAVDYNAFLMDGQKHTLSVTWENSAGAWSVYIDGSLYDSGTGLSTGQNIPTGGTLMFGLEQDSVGGGFESQEYFNGTLYDIRLFDDLRTSEEIRVNQRETLPNTEAGLIANWTVNDLSVDGIITDAVGGNHLTVTHHTGSGFSANTPQLQLSVHEDAPDTTVIGQLGTIDQDAGDTFSYTLIDNADGRFALTTGGELSVANTSSIAYGTATSHDITVQVTDATPLTYQETLTILVTTDEAPIGINDTATTDQDTPLNVAATGVIANDLNLLTLDATGLSVSEVEGAAANLGNQITLTSGALLTLNADGSYDYDPNGQFDYISLGYTDIDTFNYTVTDGVFSDTSKVTITITGLNEIPVITSDGGGATAAVNAPENQTAVTTVTVDDVDSNDVLTYSLTGGADSSLFSISSGGVLTFDTAPNFEVPGDTGGDNVYNVQVSVDDGMGGSDVQDISVTVTDANDAPAITSTAITSVLEDDAYSYTITALDEDADGVSLSAPTLPAWLSFTDNGDGTATLSGTPSNDEVGIHAVVIEASDGSLLDTQSFNLTVINTNDAPEITSDGAGVTAAVNAVENQTAVTTVTADDVDIGDVPTFSITGGADSTLFSIDTNTGVLTFASAPDYEVPGDANGDSVYEVEVTADDSNGGTDMQAISITVTDANDAPEITSNGGGATATIDVAENETSVTTVTSSDADGDTVTYSITGGADGTMFSITPGGILTFDAAPDFESPADDDGNGVYEVQVTADDSNGGTDVQTISVTVTNVQPVISASGNATVDEDTSYTLNLGADEHVSTWTINWGDGTVQQLAGAATSATHTYENGGFSNNITISATDADGTVLESGLVAPGFFGDERLYRLDSSGSPIDNIGTGTGLGQSLSAIIGPDGLLYVSSYTTDEIRRFDPVSGSDLGVFVSSGAGGLDGPAGMAFGADGHLYVSSNLGDSILKFSSVDGAFLETFVSFQSGGLEKPDDLTFGPDGDLYATSFNTDEVLRYDGFTGEFRETFVTAGAGGLDAPSELTFGPDGNLYVTSVLSDQVLRFDGSNGGFIDVFASGMGLDEPRGAVFGPDGHLYVADRSSVFKFDGNLPSGGISPSLYASSPTLEGPSQIIFLPSQTVTVNPVNNAPVVVAPGSALNAIEQTNLALHGAGFSVSDEDAGATIATARLTVGEGAITVDAGDSGISIVSGNGTGSVMLSGRVSHINTLLTGASSGTISYFNDSDTPSASTTLTLTVNDGGGSGADPGLSGTASTEQGSNSATITVAAVNDSATIGGTDTASLVEDTGVTNGYLNTSGTLTSSDVDNPDDTFISSTQRGSLGDLVIDASGNWTYSVNNSLPAIQGLSAGSSIDDVITISSIDGTTHNITITINGNAAPLASADNYTVSEDASFSVDWWDGDWSRRSIVTLDNSAQTETLNDVPVLLILNSGNIDYSLTQNDGSDLRFFDGDGKTLAYDVEAWDESGDSYVWVKVPQIIGGSNSDTITMYWGNASAGSAENGAAVWSDSFAAVHHLHDDLQDATAQRNTGTNAGSVDATGQVGDGQLFDGSDDALNLGDDSSLQNIFDAGGTVSAWINPTGWGEGDYGRILDKSGTTTPHNGGWALELFGGGQNALLFQIGFSGSLGQWYTGPDSISLNSWNHVSLSYDASSASNTPEIHINGVLQTLTSLQPTGTVGSDAGYDLMVGNHSASTIRTFDGVIDNVEISSTVRSSDWTMAQYLATSGSFASIGAAQSFSGPSGLVDNDVLADPHPPIAGDLDTTGTLGLVTLNSDGTFSYDTNGQFESLAVGADATDTFSYTLDDGVNPAVTTTVSVTVSGANDLPEITSDGGGDNAALSASENQVAVTTVTAGDVDGDTLSYSITGGADQALFEIDSNSGALTFVAAPNFESPGDSGSDGSYEVEVRVDDGNGGTDTQTIVVSVTDDNDTPVITSDGGGATANLVAPENQTAVTTVTGADEDGDGVMYSITGGADQGLFNLTTGGVLTFAAAPDREMPGDANADGIYVVEVTASDGLGGTGVQTISVTVSDIDEFDVGSLMDSNVADNEIAENASNGDTVGVTALASDDDATNNTITYSLDDNSGGRFTIDSSTGVVTVADNTLLDRTTDASHDITVRATSSDGSFNTAVMTIIVNDVDEFDVGAVTDSDVTTNAVDENAANGTTAGVTALASDADATTNTITYTLGDSAGGRFTIDGNTHEAAGEANTEADEQNPETLVNARYEAGEAPDVAAGDIAVAVGDGLIPAVEPRQQFDSSNHQPVVTIANQIFLNLMSAAAGIQIQPLAPIDSYDNFDYSDEVAMQQVLDQLTEEISRSADSDADFEALSVEFATAALSVTAGVLMWVLRTGSLAASLLSVMPVWQQIDPLPILSEGQKILDTDFDLDQPDDIDPHSKAEDFFEKGGSGR